MLFNLTSDEGHKIEAYVVPDAGSTTPSIILRAGSKELLKLAANNTITALVDAGRHTTGHCGFVVDESLVPDLATMADLEVYEASRNMLIYRRRSAPVVEMQIFRFETHLLPLWRIDEALKNKFQFWYKGIDRFGRETATQVFCINNGGSIYSSGRLQYVNYEHYLGKGTIKTACLIRDPYLELAERLVLLKNIGSQASEILGERDVMLFTPAIEELGKWANIDEGFCARFFKRCPSEVSVSLSNPLVRQLTASTPDEMPRQGAVATALETLASFELLGLRSDGLGFSTALAEMAGVEAATVPEVREYPRIVEIGEYLRRNHDVEAILEKDLEVFQSLANAFDMAKPA